MQLDNEETKVPIPDTWLGVWQPTLKGWHGRSWRWWLPESWYGKLILALFLPVCAALLILAILYGG